MLYFLCFIIGGFFGIFLMCLAVAAGKRDNYDQYYVEEYKKVSNTLLINNKPLTWEELKQMKDKPVWIQEGDHSYWIIIDSFTITSCGTHWLNSVEGCLLKEDMGISWNAYRNEL